MIQDKNKGIEEIHYNHLNLPQTVILSSVEGDSLLYYYDAAGIKLRQEVYKAGELKTKRDYVGEFYYENDTLRFINHEEGRVTVDIENGILDYQYHLKDHLGNTRLTFSTTPESYTYTATMETELATSEEALFQNVAETRVAMALANSTSQDLVPGANKAARIESTDPIGPLAMLQVNKGDTVKLSAYAYYEGDGSTDGLISESALLAALLSGYSGASGISEVSAQTQAALESGLDFPNNLVPKTNETNDDAPKAYLNYMQFDADMNLVTSGFKQITTAAQGMKEYVETTPLTIDQNGYVLVYVSNESDELNWVHFDDFAVTHSKTPIVQVDDYYPFGLTFNSFTRNYSEPQRYKYNGMEEQEETGWLQPTEFRMYDPQLGRFMMIDPVIKEHESPYAWNTNNPILYYDPSGADSTQRADAVSRAQEFVDSNPGNSWGSVKLNPEPGDKVDCSGLVAMAMIAGGEDDARSTGTGNGVKRIADNTETIANADVVVGSLVILDNSSSGTDKPFGHIGIVSEVEINEDGSFQNLKMIDSGGDPDSGTSGPRVSTLVNNGTNKYWGDRITGFRKFDTIPDEPMNGPRLNTIIVRPEPGAPVGLQRKTLD